MANDAYDHGSTSEAAEIRERATSGLRAIVGQHPPLLELLPRLPGMLDRGLLTYTWPTVLEAIESAMDERR